MAGKGAALGAIKVGIGVPPAKIEATIVAAAILATIAGITSGIAMKMALIIPRLIITIATVIMVAIITTVVTMEATTAGPMATATGPPRGYGRPYVGNHGWQNGGYWGYRPWHTGWYNWAPNNWSWWGPSAVGWGVMGLATGAVITGLVNSAAQNQSTVIVVPDTTIRLDFASVLPAGEGVVSFRYIVGSSGPAYQSNGDCRQGLFNGQPPRSVAEAQLLNTTCHVAYGNGNNRTPALPGYANGIGNGAP